MLTKLSERQEVEKSVRKGTRRSGTVATSPVRVEAGGVAALGAAAIGQAILGLEFLLAGFNKYFDTNFVDGFKSFLASSVGAQTSVISPIVQSLILPNAALFAELAKFTELASGLVLLIATAGVRLDSHTTLRRVIALADSACARECPGSSDIRTKSAWGAQPSQSDRHEPADRGFRRQPAGCREGVEAVARQFVRRDIVP